MKPKLPSILVLTPRFPYPVVGGDRLRIYQVCKALAERCELTLLSLCESRAELEMAIPDDGVFTRVERILLPRWLSLLSCALAVPTKLPLQVAYFRSGAFRRRIYKIARDHDAILAHLIRVGDIIKELPGPKFLEMTDAISLNYERISQSGHNKPNDLRALIFSFEANRLRAYEEAIVDNFDHSFLVSDVDRTHLYHNRSDRLKKVSVVSNGVDLSLFPFTSRVQGNDVIFIGNMNSMQNFDAALYMARDIFPLIRRVNKQAQLILIGRIPPDKADELRALPGVKVTGEVTDVAAAAVSGAIGVCPLRLGAGVQNKVLEYMALGLPVVSTSMGLEGFDARPGIDLLVADNTELFAEAVITLMENRDLALRMGVEARRYVESNHAWERKLLPLVDVISSAADRQNKSRTLVQRSPRN